MATGITEEAIQKLIHDALAAQADTHSKELAETLAEQAARFRTSSASAAPAQEDFYATFARDQTKIEQSLIERDEDPVTDSGLLASLNTIIIFRLSIIS